MNILIRTCLWQVLRNVVDINDGQVGRYEDMDSENKYPC